MSTFEMILQFVKEVFSFLGQEVSSVWVQILTWMGSIALGWAALKKFPFIGPVIEKVEEKLVEKIAETIVDWIFKFFAFLWAKVKKWFKGLINKVKKGLNKIKKGKNANGIVVQNNKKKANGKKKKKKSGKR